MLPSLTNRLKVYLSPDHVSAEFFPKGSNHSEDLTQLSQPCDAPLEAEPVWVPALHAFKQLLGQFSERVDVTVYIASAFCRYQLIQPQLGLNTYAEEEAYARFSLKETFGKEVDKWAVRCTGGVGIDPQVAIAIDQALLTQIESMIKAANNNLISIQPFWIGAVNLIRKEISAKRQWIIFVESGRLMLALLDSGKWQSIAAYRLSDDWVDGFMDIVIREIQLNDHEASVSPILIGVPHHIATNNFKALGWEVKTLTITGESLLSAKYFPSAVVGAS